MGRVLQQFLCLLIATQAWSAPVQEQQSVDAPVQDQQSVDKRRESTKETIELEASLKQLAGEDKKYFSSNNLMPMPQVDGLLEESSGEPPQENPIQAQAPQENTEDESVPAAVAEEELEEELADLPPLHPKEEEDESSRFPVPGPYGPGLQSAAGAGRELEYEPSNMSQEEEEEEGDEEDYYLERVMETLRKHPELLAEILHEDEVGEEEVASDENALLNVNRIKPGAVVDDYEDRVEQIQAELDHIRGRQTPQESVIESEPQENVVIPHEYVKDDIESLNRYFDKYAGADSASDAPIM